MPTGEPIEDEARAWFKKQAAAILGKLPPDMAELPDHFPSLADYDDPMSRAMTPHLAAYWQESGDSTLGRLAAKTGLDLGEWRVTNPHLAEMIRQASFKFCKSTNQTTTKELQGALADLKQSLIEGLVEKGETPALLTKRVKAIFEGCETWKAKQIALTESSRAVHSAQYVSAEQSGVVAGFEWLMSSDACPLCQAQNEKCKRVRMGQPFAVIGNNPDYSTVRMPPLHPNDQCTVTEILLPEYGGPKDPEWGETLHHDHPGKAEETNPKPIESEPPAPKTPSPHPEPKPEPKAVPTPAPQEPSIERAMEIARKAGIEVVLGGQAALVERGDTPFEASRCPAFYRRSEKKIYINEHCDHWKNQASQMKRSYDSLWFSSKDEDHVITHEIGHALHDKAIGTEAYAKVGRKAMPEARTKYIADQVSQYASSSEVEFVAEVYAGVKAGHSYDDKIMKFYAKLGGPAT